MTLSREHFRLSGFLDHAPYFEVDAIIDPDQVELSLPRSLADALKLRKFDTRVLPDENGTPTRYDYASSVRIAGRDCETCSAAVVKGDEVVMGWLPLSSLVKEIKMPGVYSHTFAPSRLRASQKEGWGSRGGAEARREGKTVSGFDGEGAE